MCLAVYTDWPMLILLKSEILKKILKTEARIAVEGELVTRMVTVLDS